GSVVRAGRYEDRVRARIQAWRGPESGSDAAVRHRLECVDDLLRGEADLEELTLDERAVAEAGDADICITVVEERAGPVVMPGSGVAGENAPEDGAGRSVQCVPIGIAAADIHHPARDRGGRGGRGTGWGTTSTDHQPQRPAH